MLLLYSDKMENRASLRGFNTINDALVYWLTYTIKVKFEDINIKTIED